MSIEDQGLRETAPESDHGQDGRRLQHAEAATKPVAVKT